jgi:hypothetical protein
MCLSVCGASIPRGDYAPPHLSQIPRHGLGEVVHPEVVLVGIGSYNFGDCFASAGSSNDTKLSSPLNFLGVS